MGSICSNFRWQPHGAGVTFIELLAALGILVILLTVAVPGFRYLMVDNRMATITVDFVAALHYTRSEAIKRATRVGMCRSADGSSCAAHGNWDQGWIVFVDGDTTGTVDGSDTVLRVHQALGHGDTLVGNSHVAAYISYVASGLSRTASGAMQAGTIVACNPDPEIAQGRDIVMSASGRVRVVNPSASCT